MIGFGLVSFGREDFREQALGGIAEHVAPVVDRMAFVFDCSPVGVAKNKVIRRLLEDGCTWIVISEDDVVAQSPDAILGYVKACEESGYEHLMFHGHGPHNPRPVGGAGPVTLWPNYVGAWSIYSRNCLEKVGLFDENFYNAWEHVEHSLRLAEAGFTAPWRGAADATGSENWLQEIPGSIERSVIRPDPTWAGRMAEGQEYWKATYPDSYFTVFRQ